jgi:tetratricopeptide (TPR) repeat protein
MDRARASQTRGVMVATLFLMGSIQIGAQSPALEHFTRGVSALHTFEYEDAIDAFREAQRADPAFPMAWWGEAMTYNQTLWRKEDIAAGRRALARLSGSARARLTTTPLEKGYLDAVAVLFGEGDVATRHRKYAEAMQHLYETYPDDADVAAFYALALLGTMSRSLIGYEDSREGHVHGLAGSEVQTRVAAILTGVLKSHPDHLGALHYLLHAYDDPEHARFGLEAARSLEKLAPPSSHARHMPAHIFLQLGMWREAAAADKAAFDASDAWIKRRNLPATLRNYHALSWLQYELLQRGRYREAADTIRELEPVVKASGDVSLLSDLSSMRARYVVESRRWNLMGNERQFANVHDLFAVGVSAARTGNTALAELARQALATRAHAEREGDLRPAIAIMEREVSAVMDRAAGRNEQAIQTLRKAAEAELRLPAPLGLPEPLKPAPELLGEVLLEIGRAPDALEPFQQTLRRHPNRSLSVLGLARAAVALGDIENARLHYRQLLSNFEDADNDVPELQEARHAIESIPAASAAPRPDSHAALILVTAAVGITCVMGFVVLRRREKNRRRAAEAKKPRRRR